MAEPVNQPGFIASQGRGSDNGASAMKSWTGRPAEAKYERALNQWVHGVWGFTTDTNHNNFH